MRIRKCWVESCESSADREKDKGVTYHKLPKDDILKNKWLIQSRLSQDIDKKICLICSRHFRRIDFEPYKESIFTLKSDAIPTIFPWGVTRLEELDDIFSKLDTPTSSTNLPNIETLKEIENPNSSAEMSAKKKSVNTEKEMKSNDSLKKKEKSESDTENDDFSQDNKDETKDKLKSTENLKNEKELHVENKIKEKIQSPVKNEIKIKTEDIDLDSSNVLDDIKDEKMECEVDLKVEESTTIKTSLTDASDSCGKESEETEESQSDSDNKTCETQENTVPEIETILENIFGPEDVSMMPLKNESAETDPTSENDSSDPHKSLRDILSQPIKQITKSSPKTSNAGRPKRRSPSTSKSSVKSKSKISKPKWVEEKSILEEKTSDVAIKNDKGVLVQGSRVEAKDFNDIWYPARVVEVDHDEMEVLIHYDNWSQRFDEWIYMWSPRIRIINPIPPSKSIVYKEGERCFARWSNNQRFHATVKKVLPNGQYEVAFDDGFVRVTKSAMMSKINTPAGRGTAPCMPSAQNKEAADSSVAPAPPLHNHLFDPQRDHLGTKEERRSLKKKIDVKELFSRKKKKVEVLSDVKNNDTTPKDGRGRKRKIKSEDESPLKDVNQKMKKKDSLVKIETDSIKQEPSVVTSTSDNSKAVVTMDKLSTSILSRHLTEKPSTLKKETNLPKVTSSPSVSINKNLPQMTSTPVVKSEPIDTSKPSADVSTSELITIKEEIIPSPPALNSPTQISNAPLSILDLHSPGTIPAHIILKPNHDNVTITNVDNPENSMIAKRILPQFNIRAGDKDWCCKWLNDQPIGTFVESESQADRITFLVPDHRLPPGWRKLLTKKHGTETTKWDVVIICPAGRRYRTRGEMQDRLMESDQSELEPYALGLLDFSAHRKQARRKGWDVKTSKSISNFSMSDDQHQILLNKKKSKKKNPSAVLSTTISSPRVNSELKNSSFQGKDFIYVGSLKVQVIDNLLRCPIEGCFKNFRKDNLLQMHVKHYHPEMCKFFGDTPNVADLAYARVVLDEAAGSKAIDRYADVTYGVKKESEEEVTYKQSWKSSTAQAESSGEYQYSQHSYDNENAYTGDDSDHSGKNVWEEKKVICNPDTLKMKFFSTKSDVKRSHKKKVPEYFDDSRHKKKKMHDNARDYAPSSDYDETRSSFGVADQGMSKNYEHNVTIKHEYYPKIKEEKDDSNQSSTIITESGERIKIVHMKREEIINCHCGFGEEDGLMIQCELCLCWQHALCHNIKKESEVPDKYVCLICLQPYRGRRSQKHLHAQEWLYEGRLPRAIPSDSNADVVRANLLKKSHELTANLLQLKDLMHSLRCKIEVAEKKDHPKLYLWSKPWDNEHVYVEPHDIRNKETKDIPILIKEQDCDPKKISENIPLEPAEKDDLLLDTSAKETENPSSPTNIESQTSDGKCDTIEETPPSNIFSNLLVSPGGTGLELPISNSELENLAKSVQISAPQPEAAIESSECRTRLLQHIERTQLLLEARLDSIEAQIAELESQDPSTGDDETPDHFPRTKQTIQMLLRDLSTLEELGTLS